MLPYLEFIYMENNLLTGTIPGDFVEGSKITEIFLQDNYLTGRIPVQLMNASNLNILHLENNALTGEVPVELSNLKNLVDVGIQYNNITGILPFQNCSQFETLEADCDSPEKVICECCTTCFGLFTRAGNIEGCVEGKLRLEFDVDIGQALDMSLRNTAGEWIDLFILFLQKK